MSSARCAPRMWMRRCSLPLRPKPARLLGGSPALLTPPGTSKFAQFRQRWGSVVRALRGGRAAADGGDLSLPPDKLASLMDPPRKVTGLRVFLNMFSEEEEAAVFDEASPLIDITARIHGGLPNADGETRSVPLYRDVGIERPSQAHRKIYGMNDVPSLAPLLDRAHCVGALVAYPDRVFIHDVADPVAGLPVDGRTAESTWVAYLVMGAGNVFSFRHALYLTADERPVTFDLLVPRGSVVLVRDNALFYWEHGTQSGDSLSFKGSKFRRQRSVVVEARCAVDRHIAPPHLDFDEPEDRRFHSPWDGGR